MPKRYALVMGIWFVLLSVALLLPSTFLRTSAALLSAVVGVFLLTRLLLPKPTSADLSTTILTKDEPPASSEFFAMSKLFEATMEGMREGLLIVDQDMRVVASNPESQRLFNRSGERLSSLRLTELTRNSAIYGAFQEALQGRKLGSVKVESQSPERRIFDLRVVPLSGTNGGTGGAIGVFFDITLTERLERVRQEFLSNVSHELRTPLTAILAFVETLENGAIDDRENSRRFLSIIRKNASRMHNLIGDILELSAIEFGNVSVEPELIELGPLTSDVITSLAAKASSRKIAVQNEVAPGTRVLADPRRLEQMLTNLVDNAIKFNREGGTVTITCDNGPRTRIVVADTGEGIPGRHLDRLFERFYRVDRARSREMEGTGLGLAIVKHLAKVHGGEVKVESRLGEGSAFEIDLPRPEARTEEVPGS